MDMEPRSRQPHQEQGDGRSWLGPARAGQVQELPKGSLSALGWDLCQGPATSREAFVEPGMGSSTPCLNSKASISFLHLHTKYLISI